MKHVVIFVVGLFVMAFLVNFDAFFPNLWLN